MATNALMRRLSKVSAFQWTGLAVGVLGLGAFTFFLVRLLREAQEAAEAGALTSPPTPGWSLLTTGRAMLDAMSSTILGHSVNPNGRRIDVLHPKLRELLEWADKQPWKTLITSTVRTVKEQTALALIGRTTRNPWTNMDGSRRTPANDDGTLGPTVAPAANSQTGLADPAQHGFRGDRWVHAFDFSYNSMSPEARDALVAKAESMDLQWGGRWLKKDLVHIETKVWRQVGPPPADLAS